MARNLESRVQQLEKKLEPGITRTIVIRTPEEKAALDAGQIDTTGALVVIIERVGPDPPNWPADKGGNDMSLAKYEKRIEALENIRPENFERTIVYVPRNGRNPELEENAPGARVVFYDPEPTPAAPNPVISSGPPETTEPAPLDVPEAPAPEKPAETTTGGRAAAKKKGNSEFQAGVSRWFSGP